MAVSARSRKLIDPFNHKVRERIFGFSDSSGSEYDAVSSSSSPRLSYLVQTFLEDAGDPPDADESEDDPLASDPIPIVRRSADRFRTDLLAHANTASEMFSLFRETPTVFNRTVMAYLREIGYDSGVCRMKWEADPRAGLIAGSYEFIDVLDRNSRYIVDLNFSAQFEIARRTERYSRVIGALPRLFVGNLDDLKRIVRITAGELKRSMKMNEMSLPPWRKSCYMQAKWFGPYNRSVNQLPVSGAVSQSTVRSLSSVKCSVGFFTSAVDGRLVVAPSTTRTR